MVKQEDVEAWVRAALPYYRNLGFFAWLDENPDAHALEPLIEGVKQGIFLQELSGGLYEKECEYELVWADKERVAACDWEGANTHTELLERMAAITRGVFTLTQIEEIYDDPTLEEHYFRLNFRLNDVSHSFMLELWADCINLTVLSKINALIAHTGYTYQAFDETAGELLFLMLLTEAEKDRLKKEQGFVFRCLEPPEEGGFWLQAE